MARGPARSSWLAVVVIDPDLVAKVGGEGAGRARIGDPQRDGGAVARSVLAILADLPATKQPHPQKSGRRPGRGDP